MKQSRSTSFLKSVISTAVGFSISLAAQWTILPLLGVAISLHQNVSFAIIMTVISIVRGYLLERVFEFFGMRRSISPFMHAVIEERFRQIAVEGWNHEHDDELHSPGQLAAAGGAYAIHAGTESRTTPHEWPWGSRWWKPAGFRRDLVKACALIIAEGEKFDRSRKMRRYDNELTVGAGSKAPKGRNPSHIHGDGR